jgi:hypothetical protein
VPAPGPRTRCRPWLGRGLRGVAGARRGRRRNPPEGARCEEAVPARSADSDGDCPANSGADSTATPRPRRRQRVAPDHVARQRMPRSTDTGPHAARTPMSSASRPSSVPASACREPSAAYVGCSA